MPALGNNICTKCRSNYKAENRPVPCESIENAFVCWVTERPPDDPDEPMALHPVTRFISIAYDEIVSISCSERVDIYKKDKTINLYLPTLENLKYWVDCNRNLLEINKLSEQDFLYYINIYHRAFRAMKQKAV